jgi:hypothetical protein
MAPTTSPADEVDSYVSHGPGKLYARVVPSPATTSFTLFDGTVITQRSDGDSVTLDFEPGAEFIEGVELEGR